MSLKILVCVSKAPDTTTKIAFADNDTKFNEANVQYIINPYDEWYALVRALELTEAQGGTVTTITVGPAADEQIIRKAFAIGATDGVRVDAEPTDGFFVAKQIAEYAKDKNFDLILCGKETINYNGSQVGAMVAELLNLPYVSLATKLDVANGKATVETDIQGGTEVLECSLPLVISAAKGMAEQRIPNMRGIMAARTKPLATVAAVSVTKTNAVKKFSMPPAKSAVKMIPADNAGQLIELLHNEAKVI
ncbi:MAG TPA: electron transfer flavoprotein subunit beta/FixA family protein [Flavobacteriales bacterium]|nr:electron transfer flavoprotein subunit beta/FixA family protein [Flavobacteriales bacterium]